MRDHFDGADLSAGTENLLVKFSRSKGRSRGHVSSVWKTWESFKAMYAEENVLRDTTITFVAYHALGDSKEGKETQGEKKAAAGSWVPAVFKDGIRRKQNLKGRTMIAFDLDYVSIEQLEAIQAGDVPIKKWEWFMHTTRSHCPEKPRVRMMLPTSRLMTMEQAEAITRYLACELADDPSEGIDIPDIVSMRDNQIMYLPSTSKNQEYWTDENEGAVIDVDAFLEAHPDWKDMASWPMQSHEKELRRSDATMEDPREKKGIIGAWCRTYSVEDVIGEHLSDIYVPGDDMGSHPRYSYTLGGTFNGAIVYDDGLFLQSHHGSDPIDGQANAFDLLRVHKFGHLDKDAHSNTSPGNLPSFKAMCALAESDPEVKKERLADLVPDNDWDDDEDESEKDTHISDIDELLGPAPKPKPAPKKAEPSVADLLGDSDDEETDIADEFDDDPEDDEPEEKPKKEKKANWTQHLTIDKNDQFEKTLHNCMTIVKGAPVIANAIALNEMDGGPYVRKLLKFSQIGLAQASIEDKETGRRWTDNDTAALMAALAAPRDLGGFGVGFTRQDVEMALLQASQQNSYNPVKDRIEKFVWDGVPRIGTFFHDWLGCADNAYHTELSTVWFVAGITRLYEPGHVFDIVPILGGKQGGGKTGLIRELGLGFTGALSGDFHDTQKMAESTKGKFILEVPELKGMSKGMIEDIKSYFTATKDTVRMAYRKNPEDFMRMCLYMGTTNEGHYLRDEENRRFCPVLTDTHEYNKIDFENLIPIIPQLWAEAREIYLQMRKDQPKGFLPLHFTSKAAKAEARRLQTESRETMAYEPVAEVIENWLNAPLSQQRISSPGNEDFDDDDDGGTIYVRNLITATMIREELASNPIIRDLRGAADKVIGQALNSMPEWQTIGQCRRLGRKARWYSRFPASKGCSHDQFVPLADVPGQGELEVTATTPDVDDLLS